MITVIKKALILILVAILQYNFIMAGTIAPSESANRNIFAGDLFSVIVDNNLTENIVYSPASIQTSLALAFIGAEGKTAEEMRKVLRLGAKGNKKQVLEKYVEFLKSDFKSSNSSDNKPLLKMANRLYVNIHLEVAAQFNEIAQDFFDSRAESMDFENSQDVAKKINQWVEQQTESKIKNLLQPNAVDAETSAILVNAVYFKGNWLRPFSNESTTKSTFHMNSKDKVEVDTMYTGDEFGYVNLPELGCTALEMPYKNSDISMMIILPNEVEGLKDMEQKLRGLDLNEISSKMLEQHVEVFLPKFRIEFDVDLKEPLKKLGLNSMFDQNANFSGMFDTAQPQRISDVKHKAFLDVNEAGSEATAATYIQIVPLSAILEPIVFRADHPFVFAIRSKAAVYFAGHVTKF